MFGRACARGVVMLTYALTIWLIGTGIGAVFLGWSRIRMAGAWRIWATRCDPKNPNFSPPLVDRRQ